MGTLLYVYLRLHNVNLMLHNCFIPQLNNDVYTTLTWHHAFPGLSHYSETQTTKIKHVTSHNSAYDLSNNEYIITKPDRKLSEPKEGSYSCAYHSEHTPSFLWWEIVCGVSVPGWVAIIMMILDTIDLSVRSNKIKTVVVSQIFALHIKCTGFKSPWTWLMWKKVPKYIQIMWPVFEYVLN